MDGATYEQWVAGYDVETGAAEGPAADDDQAVRFVEVTVNGPKTWSLAAALHPEIAAAYDAAQTGRGRGDHRLARRARDHPGRTARAPGAGAGRADRGGRRPPLHLPGRRPAPPPAPPDQRPGLGGGRVARAAHRRCARQPGGDQRHRARGRDDPPGVPGRAGRARLHARPRDRRGRRAGAYAGAFSARARQIETNIDPYEAEWRADHPGEEPGPALRQAWDRRAWADARPDKVVPTSGEDLRRALGRGAARARLPSRRRAGVGSAAVEAGDAGPRRAGRDRADAAGCPSLGVERGRCPRRGRAADRRPRAWSSTLPCDASWPRT